MNVIDRIVEEIMAGLDCFSLPNLEADIRRVLSSVLIVPRPEPDRVLSDHDLVPVVLSIADWVQIADQLYLDANAEADGPVQALLMLEAAEDEERKLREELAELPCHSNKSATERCAAVIDRTLQNLGWAI